MTLFRAEHKKLWRKKSTLICVILCFLYIDVLGAFLNWQWIGFGTHNGIMDGVGNSFDGYANVKRRQKVAEERGGVMTDEMLREMVREYQRLKEEESDERWDLEWSAMDSWIRTLWPELRDPASYELILDYIDPDQISGFYERRRQRVGEFLAINNQTDREREYLLEMDSRVKEPFPYAWQEGWSLLLGSSIQECGLVLSVFIAIVLSLSFAGEWHDGMGTLILTTREGWRKMAYARIFSGMLFALELFFMAAAGFTAVQLVYMGTQGWDLPVQYIKLITVAPMNMLQAEIYQYLFVLLGTLSLVGVVMLISAWVKNNFVAVILSLAYLFLPSMIVKNFPVQVQMLVEFFPMLGSATDIFRTNTFQIFGRVIWSPYLLVTVPVLIGAACVPAAVRGWARRQVK